MELAAIAAGAEVGGLPEALMSKFRTLVSFCPTADREGL
jgi:hypothetical protein